MNRMSASIAGICGRLAAAGLGAAEGHGRSAA